MNNDFFEKLKNGQIKMVPRWHFVLRGVLVVITAVLLFIISSFLASFIFFSLRASGLGLLPGLGLSGFVVFLLHFPWLILLLEAALAVSFIVLIARYELVYRLPLLYTVLTVLIVLTAVGFWTRAAGLHKQLRTTLRGTPGIDKFYRGASHFDDKRVVRGQVQEFSAPVMVLQTSSQPGVQILVTPVTYMDPGCCNIGDEAMVFFAPNPGKEIQALGIRRIDTRDDQ